MTIKSLKELQKLIQLCRKTGVQAITVDGIELSLGSLPSPKKKMKQVDFSSDFPESQVSVPVFNGETGESILEQSERIATQELSEEQLLMWSTGGEAQ